MKLRPVLFAWKEIDVCVEGGEVVRAKVMVPTARFRPLCERQFALDEEYALGPVENVPTKSRAQFFASIRDTWNNLPDEVGKRFPTTEHFRKWLLVQVGHCTINESAFDTAKDAKQHAIALRKVDEYAVIRRSENVVIYATAKSIASNAIKREEFQVVKTKALDLAASMVGVSRGTLQREGGRAA